MVSNVSLCVMTDLKRGRIFVVWTSLVLFETVSRHAENYVAYQGGCGAVCIFHFMHHMFGTWTYFMELDSKLKLVAN